MKAFIVSDIHGSLKAAEAIASGRFRDEIVPLTVPQGRKKPDIIFDTDEFPRETSMEALAKLKPAFREGGSVTAGNSSGRNDGASALARVEDAHAPAIDLAVLAAILSSSLDITIEPGTCMAGEVGLSGEIRPVNRIEQRILEAEKLGFTRILVPHSNLRGFDTSKCSIQIVQVRKVEEAFRQLFG